MKKNLLTLLSVCCLSFFGLSQQQSFEIIKFSNSQDSKLEQEALVSEWVDQYRLYDMNRIIRFESGSVYILTSRTKLNLPGGEAEYYTDLLVYPNYFVVRDGRIEPSLKKVDPNSNTLEEIKGEELIAVLEQIKSIELKYNLILQNPEEKQLAEQEGWFTKMDTLLVELKQRKSELENN